MISINPNLVIGPPILPPATASALSATLRPIWEILAGYGTGALEDFGMYSFADVRDVARIHLWCMENRMESSDKRIRVVTGPKQAQDVVDILRQAYPEREDIIPAKEVGRGYLEDRGFIGKGVFVGGVHASQLAPIRYMPFKQSVLDTAKVFERYLEP